jgi:hypothetical protein
LSIPPCVPPLRLAKRAAAWRRIDLSDSALVTMSGDAKALLNDPKVQAASLGA